MCESLKKTYALVFCSFNGIITLLGCPYVAPSVSFIKEEIP